METLYRTMLLDYYGALLTDRQREYYDLHYNEDLSLNEIASQSGTSRQAVWDAVRRADAVLREFEEKTGFMEKSLTRRKILVELTTEAESLPAGQRRDNILASLKQLTELENDPVAADTYVPVSEELESSKFSG